VSMRGISQVLLIQATLTHCDPQYAHQSIAIAALRLRDTFISLTRLLLIARGRFPKSFLTLRNLTCTTEQMSVSWSKQRYEDRDRHLLTALTKHVEPSVEGDGACLV
jgi:hypothetical protein